MIKLLHNVLIIVLLCTFTLNATDWYVNKNASGNNDGTSPENAWINFSSIDRSTIMPGDVISILAGRYYEELTIKNINGSESSPIIIKGSGQVIIDAESQNRMYAVFQEYCSYVTVQDLVLNGGGHYAYRFRYNEYCRVINVDIPAPYADGISLKYNSNCEVAYCDIQTPIYVAEQSDCIYSQENINTIYHHNTLAVYNIYDHGHNDCLQMYKDHSTIVYNNYIIQQTEKTHNSQGIYSTNGTGVHRYYNNVINMYNTQSNALTFRRIDGTGTIEMYNNIVFGKRLYHALYISETEGPIVKNNIFVSDYSGTIAEIRDWSGNTDNIDYNVFYSSEGSKVINFNGNDLSWNDWQAFGFDQHGFNKDPNLRGNKLVPSDEFITGSGRVISFFDFDFNDKQRPENNWSIGAFEY